MLDLDALDYCGASEREKKLAIALDKYLKEHPERKEGIYSRVDHGNGNYSDHLSIDKFCELASDAGVDVSWINFNDTPYGVREVMKQLLR